MSEHYRTRDSLMEDERRRRKGAFFTPALWVDEAHAEVEKVLGPNWRKECVVWDCAAGTGNLTRDYDDWGDLYSSTLDEPDVGALREVTRGTVFQHDFLASGALPLEVDASLRHAAKEGKRLVFFLNPPYATSGVAGSTGKSRAGAAKTQANLEMKAAKLGNASKQLYAQFLYRCRVVAERLGFEDYTVAVFSPWKFMCSGYFAKFRKWWYSDLGFERGFIFCAKHFEGATNRWGVLFSVWTFGGSTDSTQDIPVRICDEEGGAVVTTGTKNIYSVDGKLPASKWVREPIKGIKGVDAPQMSSGLAVKEGKGCWGTLAPEALWYVQNKGNNVMENGNGVSWMSSAYANGHGVSILPANWKRAVALYAARKLVTENWVNQKDEYLAPVDAPQMSSGLKVKAKGYGNLVPGAFYYMTSGGNNVAKSQDSVFNTSSCSSMAHGFSVLPANWRRAVALYGARKLVADHWLRHDDEYLAPVDAPQMSSGLKVKGTGAWKRGSLCSLAIKGTTLCDAGEGTWWQSGDFTGNTGKADVLPSNWRRAVALYGARKLVKDHWTLHDDEYLAPVDTPKFSSGLKVAEKWDGGSVPGSLGVLCSMGNNLIDSGTSVMYLSGKPTHKGRRHFNLLPFNWRRAVALYSARKLVTENWVNQKDEYLEPTMENNAYEQWVNDCHVYTLLHPSNNCTAMRDVQYKGKSWRIKNHWFWKTREEVAEVADRVGAPEVAADAREEEEDAFFAKLLSTGVLALSPDAREVLDALDALWEKTLAARAAFYAEQEVTDQNPDLHLLTHDAGVYQLKRFWKVAYPEEWEEIRRKHSVLAARLQPGVYAFGFLRQ